MGMAVILVVWPRQFLQIYVSTSQEGPILNLALIGSAVSDKKMFCK